MSPNDASLIAVIYSVGVVIGLTIISTGKLRRSSVQQTAANFGTVQGLGEPTFL